VISYFLDTFEFLFRIKDHFPHCSLCLLKLKVAEDIILSYKEASSFLIETDCYCCCWHWSRRWPSVDLFGEGRIYM